MKIPDIGEIIRMGRIKLGWSQRELAKKLKLTPSAVCNWEKGKAYPPGNVLVELAWMLDILKDLFPSHPAFEVKEPPALAYGEMGQVKEKLKKLQKEIQTIKKRLKKLEE